MTRNNEPPDRITPIIVFSVLLMFVIISLPGCVNINNAENNFNNSDSGIIVDKGEIPSHYEEISEKNGRGYTHETVATPTMWYFLLKVKNEENYNVRIYVLEKDYNSYKIGDKFKLDTDQNEYYEEYELNLDRFYDNK